jgi:cytoskeletal protein CcmA (bactofilin family)
MSSGLTIEGKIEGSGNVRVAGRFKGNVNVKGEFTIESGAAVHGEVRADSVLVGGEVRGQIIATSRVEFKETGTLIGDLKAGSLAVAAGSKMRGKVEFGWKEGEIVEDTPPMEGGARSATR